MRPIVIVAVLLISLSARSQTDGVRQIDAFVALINSSTFKVQRDTIKSDMPAMGMASRTYLTVVSNGTELKKYVNHVHSSLVSNGVTEEMEGENAFYFDKGKLIKVEEYLIRDGEKKNANWYYSNGKSIYYTLQSDKSEERSEQLLKMAELFLKNVKL